jgi:hypothetical protein
LPKRQNERRQRVLWRARAWAFEWARVRRRSFFYAGTVEKTKIEVIYGLKNVIIWANKNPFERV